MMSSVAWRWLFAVSLVLLLAGCGKSKSPNPVSPPTAAETSAATNSEPAPAPVPVTPVAVSEGADMSAVLGQLTEAVRKYGFEHRRMPKTLDEVVAAGYVAGMPQAPAGKKFAIDAKAVQVVLVKQ